MSVKLRNEDMQKIVPISLFVYNRLSHTKRTLTALRKNYLAKSSDLIVISDGPKNKDDEKNVTAVRKYIRNISGFRKVALIERKTNLGLAESFIQGITALIKKYKTLIVLEDDSLTSPYFLKYMNEALNLYKNDPRVISVHGYMYPVEGKLPETFFLRGADSWGWGTWKRGWNLYQKNGKKLLKEIVAKKLTYGFDMDGSYPYSRILKNQVANKNSSWSIRWMAAAYLKNKLTLYPGTSLVKNIGFDGSGTHTGRSKIFDVKLAKHPVKVVKIKEEEDAVSRSKLKEFFKSEYKYDAFSQILRSIKNKIKEV